MRVGLLVHGLDRPPIGVTRVALELGRALQRTDGCEVVFLRTYRHGPFGDDQDGESVYLPGCGLVPGLMALGGPLVAMAARRLRLDVVHDPVGISPFTLGRWAGSYRRVLTIHDAIAFRFPAGYSWSNNFLHRTYVPATLGHVDGVITPTDHAAGDVRQILGLRRDRIWVVPNGVGEQFRPLDRIDAWRVARRFGLSRPYILYVGARPARKNLARLVAAFGRLHETMPSHDLVLVGPLPRRPDATEERVRALGLSADVRFLGPVEDADLPALYCAADLFVFPSLLEGFGLPVLEAMACGTPVVCSNASSLPEVAGRAAILVDARDEGALSRGMHQVLTDQSIRSSLRELGLRHAARYRWERSALATLDVYRQLLSAPMISGRRGLQE